jgi:hypothetical protein
MNEAQIKNVWERVVRPLYKRNSRNRAYAVTPETIRQMVALYQACGDATDDDREKAHELFEWSLEEFSKAGVNNLQPPPPGDIKPPEIWKDIWGTPLPNPFANGDLKGQSLVMQRDPELAKWLKAFATDAYGAATSWADMQAQNLHLQSIKYNEDTHAANIYANPNATNTEIGRFEKDHPELVERLKFEAQPVAFPVGRTFNLTLQGKIAKTPKLASLFRGLAMHEKAFVEEARANAQAQRAAAEAELKKLQEAEAA